MGESVLILPRISTQLRPKRRLLSFVLAILVLPAFLAGCVTAENGAVVQDERLLPQPLRTLGLTVHHAGLATGSYSWGIDDPAEVADDAIARVKRACSGNRPSVTWLGHSAAIIHIGGRCLLTDPVMEPQISPLSPLPTSLVDNPVRVEHLPEIDAIILSHGDYDHLHTPTIRALAQRFPEADIVVPLGIASTVVRAGYPIVNELQLGETARIDGLRITAVHAYHETRRNVAAAKSGEAVSWIITDGRKKILFIGDTGYGPTFKEIGRAHGPFDLLLVPMGAFEPRELVADMHANPEEAAMIARDVRARKAIGIHWGTFALSPERPQEAASRFLAAGRELRVDTRVMAIGETVLVP